MFTDSATQNSFSRFRGLYATGPKALSGPNQGGDNFLIWGPAILVTEITSRRSLLSMLLAALSRAPDIVSSRSLRDGRLTCPVLVGEHGGIVTLSALCAHSSSAAECFEGIRISTHPRPDSAVPKTALGTILDEGGMMCSVVLFVVHSFRCQMFVTSTTIRC